MINLGRNLEIWGKSEKCPRVCRVSSPSFPKFPSPNFPASEWAIAASEAFFFIFIETFLIPMRPALDDILIALVLGLVGIAAFKWPNRIDKPPDTRNF